MIGKSKFLALASILVMLTVGLLFVSANRVAADSNAKQSGEQALQIAKVDGLDQSVETVTARKLSNEDPLKTQEPNSDQNTEEAFQLLYTYLQDSQKICSQITHYTATLEKQVFADDELQDVETIKIKMREQPFSVYGKWESDGQQVLYVEGENGNRLIAKLTNGLAILRDVWRLDPESSQAMRGCRYPITQLGITRLNQRVEEFYRARASREGATVKYQEESLDGQPIMVFDVSFHSPADCEEYCRSRIMFDSVGKSIVGIENYGWTATGQPGELLERYVYHDLDFNANLSKSDFSLDNPDYGFE